MKTRKSVSRDKDDDDKYQKTAESVNIFLDSVERNAVATTLDSDEIKSRATSQRIRRKSSKEKISPPFHDNVLGIASNGAASSDNEHLSSSSFNTDSTILTKSEGKKGRNLDRVVRRMLKAKKEIEEPQIPCEAKEITSNVASINRITGDLVVCPNDEAEESVERIVNKSNGPKNSGSGSSEGMIDVQLSSENYLTNTEEVVSTSTRDFHRPIHRPQSHRDLIVDSCSGSDVSPACDSEGSSLQPFVRSSLGEAEESSSMSPIIKQEPIVAADGRLSMYHQNGPGMDSHSPASSYNSQPSPEHRSPSPVSPRESHAESIPSSQQLALDSAMNEVTSRNATMIMMNAGVNSQLHYMYSRCSPQRQSPHAASQDLSYTHDTSGSGVTAAAMAASGIGLPTLVPTVSAIPCNGVQRMLHGGLPVHSPAKHFHNIPVTYATSQRNGSDHSGIKVSPHAPSGSVPTRGIVGHKEAAAASAGRNGGRRGGNVDEKCPYKRPPHTYPALIASAILDSPGNLITLRGIYDYIMNNFPYYKFGHDKSAWQNSIRHNLSLNQCFVKVPRYENAAKSNYWTMTKEGFEEFGNENSFKRRRRRGATLTPISAYKNKKCNGVEGARNGKQRSVPVGGNSVPDNKALPAGMQDLTDRCRTPESGINYGTKRDSFDLTKALKRAVSPNGDLSRALGGKHPRMMILKQGEGPTLEGIGGRADLPQRPNSLSSVEEMQGNLNSFSKILSAATQNSMEANRSPRRNFDRNSPAEVLKQQWMIAAMQKNLFPPGMIPDLTLSAQQSVTHQDRYSMETCDSSKTGTSPAASGSEPVLLNGIEIGSRTTACYGNIGASKWSYLCRFCDYKYVENNSTFLEKHCQLTHQFEISNAKAIAAAAAAMTGRLHDGDANSKSPNNTQEQSNGALPPPNMIPGLSPAMLAAATSYSNAQNFLAAAQTSGLPLSAAYANHLTVPSVTNASSYFVDTLTRALAHQINSGNSDARTNAEGIRRQQFLPTPPMLSTTELSNLPQDQQLRQLIYQQFISQNPFFPGNSAMNSATPRPTTNVGDMSQLAQQLLQYHQQMMEMAVRGDKESIQDGTVSKPSADPPTCGQKINRRESSSSASSRQNERTNETDDSEKQEDIHGWKQCQYCDFTAKGAHGLELHFRKAHATEVTKIHDKQKTTEEKSENIVNAREKTPENENQKLNSIGMQDGMLHNADHRREIGTQTCKEEDHRICEFCDITFGDDTMYALHMTCHNKTDPFRCKICNQDCHEKYYFNVHLLQGLHHPNSNKIDKRLGSETVDRVEDHRSKAKRETCSQSTAEVENNEKKLECGVGFSKSEQEIVNAQPRI